MSYKEMQQQMRKHKQQLGFSVFEVVLASALLGMGLAGAVRLSATSLAATQVHRNLDLASGLAQDLAECWGVQTEACAQAFSTKDLTPLSSDPSLVFQRTWQIQPISLPNSPAMTLNSLQELRIRLTWMDGLKSAELQWVQRRATTPAWIGI